MFAVVYLQHQTTITLQITVQNHNMKKFSNKANMAKAKYATEWTWAGDFLSTASARKRCIELSKQGICAFYKTRREDGGSMVTVYVVE